SRQGVLPLIARQAGPDTSPVKPPQPPPPAKNPSVPPAAATYGNSAVEKIAASLSAGAAPGYSIQLYSRDINRAKQIGDGTSFGFNDPKLGELAAQDLKAVIVLNGPP